MHKAAYKLLPVITDYCRGCRKCVKACPNDCIEMERGRAKLMRPDDCVSEELCGQACVQACVHGGIRMEWLESLGDQTVGRWSDKPLELPPVTVPRFWPLNLLMRGR